MVERRDLINPSRTDSPLATSGTNDIGLIAKEGIALVDDEELRKALTSAYDSESGATAVANAHQVFEKLTSTRWSTEVLAKFLANWRSSHGTALFVSGLIVRIQREANKGIGTKRSLLHQAASEIGEIIAEDTGIDDTPHNELFANFANSIVGDDRWQLTRYTLPECMNFRVCVKNRRLAAGIEDAILTTAASENWNTGEYTYFNRTVQQWMKGLLPAELDVAEKARYVSAHAGPTELGHFLHALKAWRLYGEATGCTVNTAKAGLVFECYLHEIASMFKALYTAFEA